MFKFSRIITRQLASCKWITGVVFLSAYIFFSHVPTANAAAAPSDYSRLRDAMNTDPANGIAATKDYLAKKHWCVDSNLGACLLYRAGSVQPGYPCH